MSMSEPPRANGQHNGAAVIPFPPEIDSGDPADRFSFIYPSDIELQPRRWLVPGLLPRTGFGVLFGPSGCGKSFWGVHIGLSIALGRNLLDKATKQAGVIYVAAEDAEGVQFRTLAWIKAHEVDQDITGSIPFAVVPQAPDLSSEEDGDADALIAAIKREAVVLREHGASPGLVIVDTYRDAMPGLEENDSRQTIAAVRTLRRIGEAVNALVIVVAHTAKGGDGEDPRGSGALIGAADVALGVRLDEGKADAEGAPAGPPERVLWVRKQRNGPDAKGDQSLRWAYEMQRVALDVIGEDGEAEASCVVQVIGAPVQSGGRSPKLSDGAKVTERAIVALLSNQRGQRPPEDIPCPSNRLAVRIEDLREQARILGISDASAKNPAEAVRKAVSRGKQELIAQRRIYESDGWIWMAKQ